MTIELTVHEAFVVELALQRQVNHYHAKGMVAESAETDAIIGKFTDQLIDEITGGKP